MKHVAVLAAALFACQPPLPDEVKSSATRADALTIDAAKNTRDQIGRGIRAVNALGATPDSNVIFSPLSFELVLAMLEAGAGGETKEEIDAYFADPALHDTMNAVTQALAERKDVEILSANALFVDRQFKEDIKPGYLDALARSYGTGVKLVDFATDGASEINGFAEVSTKGKITKVVTQEQVSSLVLALSNAFYFKADWKSDFKAEDTRDGTFHAPGRDVTAKMMSQTTSLLANITDDVTAVELPYKNENLVADIVIPKTDDATGIIDAITAMEPTELELQLPKFKLREEKLDLLTMAQATFGIRHLFGDGAPDLGGIADLGLVVTFFEQAAVIEVDEKGTVAAAVSVAGAGITSAPPPPKNARFDRPFYFVLRDKPTGAVLFIARVKNPL